MVVNTNPAPFYHPSRTSNKEEIVTGNEKPIEPYPLQQAKKIGFEEDQEGNYGFIDTSNVVVGNMNGNAEAI